MGSLLARSPDISHLCVGFIAVLGGKSNGIVINLPHLIYLLVSGFQIVFVSYPDGVPKAIKQRLTRQESRLETRARLLDSAAQLFAKGGYEGRVLSI